MMADFYVKMLREWTEILNLMWTSGETVDKWKEAVIIPIF